jgi:fructose-1-phosphate kinase PfkB-like protein
MSQTEQTKFHAVFSSRSKDTADKKLANLINRFMGDVMLLRFTVMFNTKPNEAELKKTLDKMIKEKDPKSCYSEDDMKQVKGLLVGTAEQKTLTVAQSEAIRCYMQRFNSVRACMGICDDKKV